MWKKATEVVIRKVFHAFRSETLYEQIECIYIFMLSAVGSCVMSKSMENTRNSASMLLFSFLPMKISYVIVFIFISIAITTTVCVRACFFLKFYFMRRDIVCQICVSHKNRAHSAGPSVKKWKSYSSACTHLSYAIINNARFSRSYSEYKVHIFLSLSVYLSLSFVYFRHSAFFDNFVISLLQIIIIMIATA